MSDTDDLRCIIERLDAAAKMTAGAAAQLASELEVTRLLAAEDRVQMSRLILLVQRLTQQGQSAEMTAAHVAQDLADSNVRADEAPSETPGAGADAAMRSAGETAAEVASHSGAP